VVTHSAAARMAATPYYESAEAHPAREALLGVTNSSALLLRKTIRNVRHKFELELKKKQGKRSRHTSTTIIPNWTLVILRGEPGTYSETKEKINKC
jgi:hypothetical protein